MMQSVLVQKVPDVQGDSLKNKFLEFLERY